MDQSVKTGNFTDRHVADVDWRLWVPRERAVLCFIRDAGRVALIHKKTGLGTGKINAPGGRIEAGETAAQAAVRECIEEIGLTPHAPSKVGELHFIFTDGYSLHGTVFIADGFSGEMIETREATPFWCPLDGIPYEKMWEDDRYWLPPVLSGKFFKGYFIFSDDVMLDKRVEVAEQPLW
jgi:8-oxo-dGTP diphosphatase